MTVEDDDIVVQFAATGDDGACGTATGYRVSNGAVITNVAPGTTTVRLAGASYAPFVSVQAVDESGNAGFAAVHAFPHTVLPRTGAEPDHKTMTVLAVMAAALVARRLYGLRSRTN